MSEVKHVFCWVDIPVLDLDRAINFYSLILKKEVKKISEHGCDFALLPHENHNVAGCLTVMENRKPSIDGPLVYVDVEGYLAEATEIARNNGGTVLLAMEKMGPNHFRSMIIDSEGNGIALYSRSEG